MRGVDSVIIIIIIIIIIVITAALAFKMLCYLNVTKYILSGVHFSSPQKLTTFLVVALKTHAKTI